MFCEAIAITGKQIYCRLITATENKAKSKDPKMKITYDCYKSQRTVHMLGICMS